MFNRQNVKLEGKSNFKANYWRSVLTALILSLIAGCASASSGSTTATADESQQNIMAALIVLALFIAVKIFILNPLEVGCYRFFNVNSSYKGTAPLSTIKEGFSDYGRTFLTLLLRDIYIFLWTLLFIIPGFVKAYSYRMVPFILKDNPELSPNEVITKSRKMMDGNKMDVFIFDLSYIGWYLLGIVTFGLVNVFWTSPYHQNANGVIYRRLISPGKGY